MPTQVIETCCLASTLGLQHHLLSPFVGKHLLEKLMTARPPGLSTLCISLKISCSDQDRKSSAAYALQCCSRLHILTQGNTEHLLLEAHVHTHTHTHVKHRCLQNSGKTVACQTFILTHMLHAFAATAACLCHPCRSCASTGNLSNSYSAMYCTQVVLPGYCTLGLCMIITVTKTCASQG